MAPAEETSLRWIRFGLLVLGVSILQSGLINVIAVTAAQIRPDLHLVLLVFFATHAGSRDAVIASFAVGLAGDLVNPSMATIGPIMGPRLISYGLAGTLLSDLHRVISIRRRSHVGLAILATGTVTAVLAILLTFLRGRPAGVIVSVLFLWQPLYTAVLGPFLFLPLAWWMRIRTARPRRF